MSKEMLQVGFPFLYQAGLSVAHCVFEGRAENARVPLGRNLGPDDWPLAGQLQQEEPPGCPGLALLCPEGQSFWTPWSFSPAIAPDLLAPVADLLALVPKPSTLKSAEQAGRMSELAQEI